MHRSLAFILFVCVALSSAQAADSFSSSPARPDRQVEALTVANIFSDRMVLQRDKPVRLWGWSKAGDAVTASFADQEKTATASATGSWQVVFDPLKASFENRELTLKAGDETIVLHDVLVGEVWLCGGQSNMEMRLASSVDADIEIASAEYPAMRFIRLPKVANTNPQADFPVEDKADSQGHWYSCQPQHVGSCTGVGYYFGRRLHRMLRVPVGLIDTSCGGTMAQHWVEHSRLEPIPEMKVYLDKFAAKEKAWEDGGQAKGAEADYTRDLPLYEAAMKTYKKGDPRPKKPQLRKDPSSLGQPSGMLNGVIAPLSGYSLRGVLFYQGENNSFGESWKPFHRSYPAVIETFRKSFGEPDLPFGIVQIAGWSSRRSMSYDMNHHCNVIREIQFDVWRKTENTGLIVSFDANSNQSIHPARKLPLGERSARWALAEVYDAKTNRNQPIPWRGPIFERMEIQDGKCVLHFDKETSGGLRLDKDLVVGFYMAGEDRVFHADVQARVNPKDFTVIVWSDSVKTPLAVRYAQSNLPIGGLMNGNELPAYPFRSDDWPITPHQSTGSYVRSEANR
jgi:sialate O-acetylesterase